MTSRDIILPIRFLRALVGRMAVDYLKNGYSLPIVWGDYSAVIAYRSDSRYVLLWNVSRYDFTHRQPVANVGANWLNCLAWYNERKMRVIGGSLKLVG